VQLNSVREALKNVGGDALARQIFQKSGRLHGCGGRATQEQLPSLHVVNEHFFGKFNDARASEVIFQSFLSNTSTEYRLGLQKIQNLKTKKAP
jgi:hypothetical protein